MPYNKNVHITGSRRKSPLSDLPVDMIDGKPRLAAIPLKWKSDLEPYEWVHADGSKTLLTVETTIHEIEQLLTDDDARQNWNAREDQRITEMLRKYFGYKGDTQ